MTSRTAVLAVALCCLAVAVAACDHDAPTVADPSADAPDDQHGADAINVTPMRYEARSFGAWAPVIRVEDMPGTHPTLNIDSSTDVPSSPRITGRSTWRPRAPVETSQ